MVVNRDGLTGRAASQETVAVISRGGTADAVLVTTRIIDADGRTLFDQSERVWVHPDGDGNYNLALTVPEPDVAKGGQWFVHALLPAGAKPKSESDGVQPPAIDGGRTVLSWSGTADPLLPIVWSYI